ncbi:MAG: hypothetical protein U5L45_21305 [Saprospiraceae bacterium]|nr:hypothetical protein [Saprospiraceae bacterium]
MYENPAFIDFISPFFARSYKKILLDSLKKSNYPLLEQLVNNTPKLMSEEGVYETNSVLESWIEAKIEDIEDITAQVEDGVRFSNKEIDHLFDAQWVNFLNELPDYFTDLKDSYIIALYNLSGCFWNTNLYGKAKKMLKNAFLIRGSAYEQGLLRERHNFYEQADTHTLTALFTRMYHMAIFQKPQGITLGISWIFKVIATPVILPLQIWERFSEWINRFIIGGFVASVGNFILSCWVSLYAVWFFFGSIGTIASLINSSKGADETATYSQIIPILKNFDDSIDYYDDRIRGMKFETAAEGQQLRLNYDTLINRRAIYQARFNRFYEIEDSLRTFAGLTERQKNKNNGEWLKKSRILEDSINIYRQKLDPIARNYSFLLVFTNNVSVREKNGQLDTASTNALKQKLMETRDSIRFYDKKL